MADGGFYYEFSSDAEDEGTGKGTSKGNRKRSTASIGKENAINDSAFALGKLDLNCQAMNAKNMTNDNEMEAHQTLKQETIHTDEQQEQETGNGYGDGDAEENDGEAGGNTTEDNSNSSYNYPSENPDDYRRGGYHPIDPGDCLKQRYFVISKLGWGHYSIVWLCFDTLKERYCAIKIVKSDELYADSARHEMMLLRHLNTLRDHPLRHRIVKLIDNFSTSGVNGTHQCLVFEMLGDNMLMLIQRSNYKGLPMYNVKQIAQQLLQGLVLLHLNGNIIHTDIKPENVLLISDDIGPRMLATQASFHFLYKHSLSFSRPCSGLGSRPGCEATASPSLSKTAKRKLRSKAKTSLNFFKTHRKWLRDRGIADLQVLAEHGFLSRKFAVDAVLGLLPFMPFEGPQILNEHDVMMFTQRLLVKQVGDAFDEDSPNTSEEIVQLVAMAKPQLEQSYAAMGQLQLKNSKACKKLYTNMVDFMQHVAKMVAKHEKQQLTDDYHRVPKKRSRFNFAAPIASTSSPSSSSASTASPTTSTPSSPPSSSSSPTSVSRSSAASWSPRGVKRSPKSQCVISPRSKTMPNLDLIKKLDPAKSPCNLQIAIADLGNSCFVNRHVSEDIQTREYRAIEVILGAGYDTSADMWSAACLIWEMATGEYLFEPSKWEGSASVDEAHVAQIIETLGPIPKTLIRQGEYADEIFDEYGKLLTIKHLVPRPMDKILVEKYNWSAVQAKEFADFLTPMLHLDPRLRSSAISSLVHPWLKFDA
ncbi:SRSF protein kinase 3-like [Drosophila albomicans]|uniref:non-specific serine/threonine protein kinase n=1 Tax=Drosophila albomicans TaxID=7291 RepID=A0A9C6T4E2_DROAB|nr:SRSF protein kinase 3-like [Drosophila albomicans]